MFFTLAVSAVSAARCAALADRARIADPAVMPIPGPAMVAWRSPDGRAAVLHWGSPDPPDSADETQSYGNTIWVGSATPGSGRAPVFARTSVTRVDPVYLAEVPGGAIVCDRAMWAAWTASRLEDHDPLHLCALLNPGFPLGGGTAFRDVYALPRSTTVHLLNGDLTGFPTPAGAAGPLRAAARAEPVSVAAAGPGAGTGLAGLGLAPPEDDLFEAGFTGLGLTEAGWSGADSAQLGRLGAADGGARLAVSDGGARLAVSDGGACLAVSDGGARAVAQALVAAVVPLRGTGRPVELSLTGSNDSRLIAAALVAAGVPVTARTHGFADHPDVMFAAEVARRLGVEHTVATPPAPGQQVDVLARIRAAVLVGDGMLSAFENVGRPDPVPSLAVAASGHGGELLYGGYAGTARLTARAGWLGPVGRAARAVEVLRRLTTRRLGLLRRQPARSYLASLAPWSLVAARHPFHALDDFYLVNRVGRWAAPARQAYLLREPLVQPLFDDQVVLAARAVPLRERMSGTLAAAVLAELSPAIAEIPLTSTRYSFDWRRHYGDAIASFLSDYILDQGTSGGLFSVVSRPATEKLLTLPHRDRTTVWTLATLACLMSGDYRRAREATPSLPVA